MDKDYTNVAADGQFIYGVVLKKKSPCGNMRALVFGMIKCKANISI
jgi:hypothetical protein